MLRHETVKCYCLGSDHQLEVKLNWKWYSIGSATQREVILYRKWYSIGNDTIESDTLLLVILYWKWYSIGNDTIGSDNLCKVKLYGKWTSIGSATLVEAVLYGKWNCIVHFCRNMDNTCLETQIWIRRHVPKFELVVTDRADAAVMVHACIQVVDSKLRQAATYAADFYSVGMLYESQSIATFQQRAISAGCLLRTEICMHISPSSVKNWVLLTLQTCIQELSIWCATCPLCNHKINQ
jgi:hypothetical protein